MTEQGLPSEERSYKDAVRHVAEILRASQVDISDATLDWAYREIESEVLEDRLRRMDAYESSRRVSK